MYMFLRLSLRVQAYQNTKGNRLTSYAQICPKSSRASYGDDAVSYVQLKRDSKCCTVKCKICPEHKVHAKLYGCTLVVDEENEVVLSVQCEDCVASQGGCKHAIAFSCGFIAAVRNHHAHQWSATGRNPNSPESK
ncbi:hypothetical protein EVAR_81335_1 [Eumeta japonica]|uniref:Uncharacterized protein n=1 Tax=Eumeta variegata TaxID=151549 RepID=A0A4C1XAS3_EUMVA|nr:hypothetical protein EVAR_81335_1 [Eumeta japonica]